MGKLKVTYRKSAIGYAHDQKRTIASLGLRKLNHSVFLPDNAAIRGMLFKVRHLVAVEEAGHQGDAEGPAPRRSRVYGEEQTS